jgi:hypothetical protein
MFLESLYESVASSAFQIPAGVWAQLLMTTVGVLVTIWAFRRPARSEDKAKARFVPESEEAISNSPQDMVPAEPCCLPARVVTHEPSDLALQLLRPLRRGGSLQRRQASTRMAFHSESWMPYLTEFALGDSPQVIFEVRHDLDFNSLVLHDVTYQGDSLRGLLHERDFAALGEQVGFGVVACHESLARDLAAPVQAAMSQARPSKACEDLPWMKDPTGPRQFAPGCQVRQ